MREGGSIFLTVSLVPRLIARSPGVLRVNPTSSEGSLSSMMMKICKVDKRKVTNSSQKCWLTAENVLKPLQQPPLWLCTALWCCNPSISEILELRMHHKADPPMVSWNPGKIILENRLFSSKRCRAVEHCRKLRRFSRIPDWNCPVFQE
nr:hypothetical protein Iba_chr14dCG18470 [Ipomoea batatas]